LSAATCIVLFCRSLDTADSFCQTLVFTDSVDWL